MELLETADSISTMDAGNEPAAVAATPFNAKAVFDAITLRREETEAEYLARNDKLRAMRGDARFAVYWKTIDSMLMLPFAEYIRKRTAMDALRSSLDVIDWDEFEARLNKSREYDLQFARERSQ